MTETFFPDIPEENWKHSEVMSNFLDIYAAPETEEVLIPKSDPAKLDLTDDFSRSEFLQTQAALQNVQEILSNLESLASKAGMDGDVKAAYMIERAIAEVQKIGSEIWSPDVEDA